MLGGAEASPTMPEAGEARKPNALIPGIIGPHCATLVTTVPRAPDPAGFG